MYLFLAPFILPSFLSQLSTRSSLSLPLPAVSTLSSFPPHSLSKSIKLQFQVPLSANGPLQPLVVCHQLVVVVLHRFIVCYKVIQTTILS